MTDATARTTSASTAVLLASLALLAAPGAAAGKASVYRIEGNVKRTSVLTTRCPINGGMATSTETTTTTYAYAFSGRSGRRGEITTTGTSTYSAERKVEGVSDAVKDAKTAPVERPLGTSKTTFASAIKIRKAGRGRKAHRVLDIDFGPIAGGLRHQATLRAPGKGRSLTHLISETLPTRDPNAGGGRTPCTATDEISIEGTVTIVR